MSENVELVCSIYADWGRGDFSSAEWADAEIECVRVDGPRPCGGTGVAERREDLRDLLKTLATYPVEPTGYRELDDGRVLVLTQSACGHDQASGKEDWVAPLGVAPAWPVWRPEPRHHAEMQEKEAAALFNIRNNRVTRIALYRDRDRALADLGLEE